MLDHTLAAGTHQADARRRTQIGSPPLQVVDKVGMAIGMVPNEWCMVAGIAIQSASTPPTPRSLEASSGADHHANPAVAQTSLHIISKSVTDKYLRLHNKTFFAPRGLVVRLVRTPALRTLLDPAHAAPSKLSTLGNTAHRISLHIPIVRKIVNRHSAPIPAIAPAASAANPALCSVAGRRLAALEQEGLVSPLDFAVPPIQEVEGTMGKANAMAVKLRAWKEQRKEMKADRRRVILGIREGRGGGEDLMSGFGKAARKARKARRRAERDQRRGRTPWASRKMRAGVEIADRKEFAATDALLWVVVLNKEHGESSFCFALGRRR